MKLVVVSSAPIVILNNKRYMYGPYQKEMKIWARYADEIQFCCPIWKEDRGLLIDEISFPTEPIIPLKEFDITRIGKIPKAFLLSLTNVFILFKAMYKADHIHLRCPGNMTLLAAIVQVLFPRKMKTAKYAGNWDSKASQPWSYRLQKWILSNTFLTKKIQVLVYGKWPNQSKNIKSFFTATYAESDKKEIQNRSLSERIRFLFVGMLSEGKQPLYVAKIIKNLTSNGFDVQLDFFGEGKMRAELEKFCTDNNLTNRIFLKGNQPKDKVELAYQQSHFLVLPSKSEGWPKVVAEAMFWGCVPIVTPVSCVPYMVDNGNRGVLLTNELEKDLINISLVINDSDKYSQMAFEAQLWSRQFTTDKFEEEIAKLLK